MKDRIRKIVDVIRTRTDFVPRVALTLGSGLGNFASELDVVMEIPYGELPDFPVSTVAGHAGKFVLGYIDQVPVICMAGRVHLYEGYSTEDVTTPLRVMHALGAQIMFLTNAAGGIKSTYHAGSLAMLTDHISSFCPNPLIGPNDDEEGVRFPDMSNVYDLDLQKLIRDAADEEQIPLDEGVYLMTSGPSFETPVEIKMFKTLGADMVGMSTVVEAIVARHCGMRVCGISLISNLAAGISPEPLSHEEVSAAGNAAAPMFTKLVKTAISKM